MSPIQAGRTITWRELWAETAERVGSRPRARWLCTTASGLDGDEWREALDRPVTHRAVAHLDAMLRRLDAGEPLQYVLGSWAFRRIDLMVDRRVLIPRPETEEVAGVAVDLAVAHGAPLHCADLGTGSGAIGLSMAFELATHSPRLDAEVWITDVSTDALDVARANLAGLGWGAPTVRVAHGSWFDALPGDLHGRLDVVVANPPYVADGDPSVDDVVAHVGAARGPVRRRRRARPHPHHRGRARRRGCRPADGWCWRSAPVRARRSLGCWPRRA